MAVSGLRLHTSCHQGLCRRSAAKREAVVPRAFQTENKEYEAPSNAPAATELSALSRLSELVPDTLIFESSLAKPTAATVSCSLLRSISSNTSVANRPYENALATALIYDKCSTLAGSDKLACQLDKALANVGAIYAGEVTGRVCTEVDPRLARDTDGLVNRAQHLVELYDEMGIPSSKLIIRVPGTWEGIQAAAQLEKMHIATQVSLIYSVVQGIAAAQAGASVIQPNVGRVRDWFNKHPGVIRDPQGPREDSGFTSGVDPGLQLVEKLYTYIKKYHPSTKVMASGLRTKDDALALAGCDYLVLGPKIIAALAATSTLQGYNDSLSASGSLEVDGVEARLSVGLAAISSAGRQNAVTKEKFEEELGVAGKELLEVNLKRLVDDVEGVLPFFTSMTTGRNI